MYSVVDIGSNTIRLTVYQVNEKQQIQTVFHEKSVAGLAGYVTQDGRMSREGIGRAVEVLSRFRSILDSLGLGEPSVFATASLRNICNTEEAVEAIRRATGFSVQVLSGEKEAVLDYIGATYLLPVEEGLILDIGGGSSELVFFEKGGIRRAVSIPVGSLNMFNKCVGHLLPTEPERRKIEQIVEKALSKLDLPPAVCPVLCGVGGSIRATGKLVNARKKLPSANRTVYLSTVERILEDFRDEEKETLRKILKVAPERLHTLLPGMTILRSVAKTFGCNTMVISDYGVREGFLIAEILKIRRIEDHDE